MAVGTTSATITGAWGAISDQTSVWVTHEGGPDIQLAIGGSAPAAGQVGSTFKAGDLPRYFLLAASEFVYARCGTPDSVKPLITVMQSAHT